MPIHRIYRRVILIFITLSLLGAAVIYSIWISEYHLSVIISVIILITIGFFMWKHLYFIKS